MEKKGMTNGQFKGIIQMLVALLKNGTPTEEIIKYLEELIKDL